MIQNHSKETFIEKEKGYAHIEKSIKEQFNLLRVVDNKRYPAYFINKGENIQLKYLKKKL